MSGLPDGNSVGHRIDGEGISSDPEKMRAVHEWPVPKNVTEVRAFVALAAYYRKFKPNFSDTAAPLHKLTRKREPFVWDDRRQRAIEQLKQALVSPPILALQGTRGRGWLT